MGITTRKICWRKNNTTYSAHLFTDKQTTPSLCVRPSGSTLYCPLESGASSNQLCVRYNNTTYHAVDVTPVVTIHYDAFSLFAQTTVSATLNVAIGNPINIMGYADAEGSGNSVIIATISAGSKTASGSTFLINYRYLGIRIGSWKNITSTPASTSGGSVTLNIDNETYWGV